MRAASSRASCSRRAIWARSAFFPFKAPALVLKTRGPSARPAAAFSLGRAPVRRRHGLPPRRCLGFHDVRLRCVRPQRAPRALFLRRVLFGGQDARRLPAVPVRASGRGLWRPHSRRRACRSVSRRAASARSARIFLFRFALCGDIPLFLFFAFQGAGFVGLFLGNGGCAGLQRVRSLACAARAFSSASRAAAMRVASSWACCSRRAVRSRSSCSRIAF